MKTTTTVTVALGLVMLVAAGSAQAAGRDGRGSVQVGQQARAVVGAAGVVHATGEKPVRWFVAERSTGGDGDCVAAKPMTTSESVRTEVTIGAGQVLCAAVSAGTTEVSWHQFTGSRDGLWALR